MQRPPLGVSTTPDRLINPSLIHRPSRLAPRAAPLLPRPMTAISHRRGNLCKASEFRDGNSDNKEPSSTSSEQVGLSFFYPTLNNGLPASPTNKFSSFSFSRLLHQPLPQHLPNNLHLYQSFPLIPAISFAEDGSLSLALCSAILVFTLLEIV